jgi:hypothetical protein
MGVNTPGVPRLTHRLRKRLPVPHLRALAKGGYNRFRSAYFGAQESRSAPPIRTAKMANAFRTRAKKIVLRYTSSGTLGLRSGVCRREDKVGLRFPEACTEELCFAISGHWLTLL